MAYTYNPIYTHFKGDGLSRSEWIQRKVVELILESAMSDADRAWSKTFELKHSSSVVQIGRLLAQKRGLSVELAEIICVMHDIYVNVTGRVTDHAHKGAAIAEKILMGMKRFTAAEIHLIKRAIYNHSDKHRVSKDPYVELVKDADVFDCGLYEGVHDAYVYEKERSTCAAYFSRVQKVRAELNLPYDTQWDSLDFINDHADVIH